MSRTTQSPFLETVLQNEELDAADEGADMMWVPTPEIEAIRKEVEELRNVLSTFIHATVANTIVVAVLAYLVYSLLMPK